MHTTAFQLGNVSEKKTKKNPWCRNRSWMRPFLLKSFCSDWRVTFLSSAALGQGCPATCTEKRKLAEDRTDRHLQQELNGAAIFWCVCWFWHFYYHVWCYPAVDAPEVHKKQTWLLINEHQYDLQIHRLDWFYYLGSFTTFALSKARIKRMNLQQGRFILSGVTEFGLTGNSGTFDLNSPLWENFGISTKAAFLLSAAVTEITHILCGGAVYCDRSCWNSTSILIVVIIYSFQTKQIFFFKWRNLCRVKLRFIGGGRRGTGA